MSKEFIEKEAAINYLTLNMCWYDEEGGQVEDWDERKAIISDLLDGIPPADVKPIPAGGIGEMSDGCHTFNGLYYQRMILFAALVKAYKDKAWKSYKHEDGELCFGGGWFIVGIDTPAGSYTYHYENKHFDLFECKELPVGKHWDGHTEKDVPRLLKLEPAVPHEMTVGELAKVYRRMCESNPNSCEGCPVCPIGNQICELPEPWAIEKMVDILPIVEAWAQEHPEERGEDSNVN